MAVLNPDPSLPSNPAPIFTDTNAARGDEMRANNNKIWGNFADIDTRYISGDNQRGTTLVSDLNAIIKSGFYSCYGAATGAPSTANSWLIIHQNSSVDNASAYQRAIAFGATLAVYERMKAASVWSTWEKTYAGPHDILSQTITTADVTLTETPPKTIILSGTLTGNRNLILPAIVQTYKIINNCTGAYLVCVKTAAGTGTYIAPKDAKDVYCDSVNILRVSSNDVGEIKAFGGSVLPPNALLCDKSAVSRTIYAELFAKIGTTWGAGDGSTTFNVPDLRESTLVGVGRKASGVTTHDEYTLALFRDDTFQDHAHWWPIGGGGPMVQYVASGGTKMYPPPGTTGVDIYKTGPTAGDGFNPDPRSYSVTHGKQTGVNFIITW